MKNEVLHFFQIVVFYFQNSFEVDLYYLHFPFIIIFFLNKFTLVFLLNCDDHVA